MQEIHLNTDAYSVLLRETTKPPEKLFIRGASVDFQQIYTDANPIIAIVGTRRPTAYGKEVAFTLARDLALQGAVIVSGLAFGIDAAAHRGALEGSGRTWAVLGSGISNIQPTYNRGLADDIMQHDGCIISEYEGMMEATKWTFPMRNRIVAGLSHAVIIVEAPIRSGALITARLALESNREVGAVPGEISSVQSLGTNALLREGASLIRDAGDVLELVGISATQKEKVDKLDEIAQNILHSLDMPKTIDEIALAMGHDAHIVREHLTSLEIEGVIENKGGIFHKIK